MSLRVWSSERYSLDLGGHALATAKFWETARALAAEGFQLGQPEPPAREDLLRAHTESWTDKLLEGRLSDEDLARAELPRVPGLEQAHLLAVQGTLSACRDALDCGLGLHAGGGAHHAFADHGEGYCLVNDLAVGAAWALTRGESRVFICDLDAHQGNGTAAIFQDRPEVFTFSMHQEDIYPAEKAKSSLDLGLPAGLGDKGYLEKLASALPEALDRHRPGLVLYQAGADVFEGDPLGGLKLSRRGVAARDRLVAEACRDRGLALAVTLGGGYAKEAAAIHADTLRAAAAAYERSHV